MCTLYEEGGTGKRQEANSSDVLAAYIRWIAHQAQELRLVRPTHHAPVILPSGSIESMKWGFRVKVPGAKGKLVEKTVVNSREDKLNTRTWKQSFQERRCLIPAAAYYEWTGAPGSKQAHRFTRPDGDVMWIAGIWDEDPARGRFYSMITTEPNRVAAFVHDRMPALLRLEEIGPFLAGEMRTFQPADDVLEAAAVESPLSPPAPKRPNLQQGELW